MNKNSNQTFLWSQRVLLASVYALSIQSVFARDPVHLTGRESEAVSVAVGEFHKDQGKRMVDDGSLMFGDLRHYTVDLERHGQQVEVIFIPDSPRLKANEAGTGGSTIYGWVVQYSVSLKTLKVTGPTFAK
jgi:hypothetical protein